MRILCMYSCVFYFYELMCNCVFGFALRSKTHGGIRRSSEAARRRRQVVTKPAPCRHVHYVQFPPASLCMSFVNHT